MFQPLLDFSLKIRASTIPREGELEHLRSSPHSNRGESSYSHLKSTRRLEPVERLLWSHIYCRKAVKCLLGVFRELSESIQVS